MDDDSAGVQDAFSSFPHFDKTEFKGLTGKKNERTLNSITHLNSASSMRPRWSHSPDYWRRNDAVKECASELFAHISSATVSEQEMAYVKECFPKSVECFNSIVSSVASKL